MEIGIERNCPDTGYCWVESNYKGRMSTSTPLRRTVLKLTMAIAGSFVKKYIVIVIYLQINIRLARFPTRVLHLNTKSSF